jgi:hypothetical protein
MQVVKLQNGKTWGAGPPTTSLRIVCDLRLRPKQSNATNTYGFVLTDQNQTQLAYAEVVYQFKLDGEGTTLVPGSRSDAVLTLLCARDDSSSRELKTLIEAQAQVQGIPNLAVMPTPSVPGPTPTLPPLPGPATPVPLPVPPRPRPPPPPPVELIPTWAPKKFDRQLDLGDGSVLFRGSLQDLASVRPCGLGKQPAQTAWVQLSDPQKMRPVGYFETMGKSLAHYCGDLPVVLPVIKRAMASDDQVQLYVPEAIVAGKTSADSMRALGFREAGDLWILDLSLADTKYEQQRARTYVRELYDLLCRSEAEAQRKIERLVGSVPEDQLIKFLESRKVTLTPTQDARKSVMELLKAEAHKYCLPAGNPEDIGLGFALFHLAEASSGWNLSPYQRKMLDYAKSALSKLWEGVKFLAEKLKGWGKGGLDMLKAVFGWCSGSALTGAGCAFALSYMCAYVNAVTFDVGAAAMAAAYTGPMGLAVSGTVSVISVLLKGLCFWFPKPGAPDPGQPAALVQAPTPETLAMSQLGEKPGLAVDLAAASTCLRESLGKPDWQSRIVDCDLRSKTIQRR